MRVEPRIDRPPRWLLAVAGAAVGVSVALLFVSWGPRHAVGYGLGSLVAVILVSLYFQLDKRRAASSADYGPWPGSKPAMTAVVVAGVLVGTVHAALLAYEWALV